MTPRVPDPAVAIVAGMFGGALVADVWLHRHDRRVVTDVLRTRTALAVQLYTLGHVLDVLGPLDLFRGMGRLIPKAGTSVTSRQIVEAVA